MCGERFHLDRDIEGYLGVEGCALNVAAQAVISSRQHEGKIGHVGKCERCRRILMLAPRSDQIEVLGKQKFELQTWYRVGAV